MKFISYRTLRSLCIDFIIFLVPTALIIFSAPFLLKLFSPFIGALFLYFAARPLNNFFIKYKLPRSLCAFLSLFIISLFLFFIIRAASQKIAAEIGSLTENSSALYNTYSSLITKASRKISEETQRLSFSVLNYKKIDLFFSGFLNLLKKELISLLKNFSLGILNAAKNIPSIFVSIFTSVFTAFFLLKENYSIFCFFRRFFGEKTCSFLSRTKNTFLSAVFSYLKAQLIIEGIIFLVLFGGFFLLKMKYVFLLSLFCTVVDAIPLFGTGTVLIPMSAFNFLSGDTSLGWGLLILYGIALLTRQLCEPKIVGKHLGIHPLATIFSLYVGMKLFGIFGFILGPLAAILIKSLIFPQ